MDVLADELDDPAASPQLPSNPTSRRAQPSLTDNGPYYRSRKFAQACLKAGIQDHRTKPYTPRTNGKVERFIQTALREWDYACVYNSSEQRNNMLPQ